jgi:glutamate-1-semialdehyde 2,1-aminomutase
MNYQNRLLNVIPGGAHTYSRGYDQFPSNAPQIIVSGDGAYVSSPNGDVYLDYGMALRAINVGYATKEINAAAFKEICKGINFTRPSIVELEAAELFVNLIDSVDMVKFTKNGSTAVTAAVKLARAYTGKEIILRCEDHPFFSFDDWFISSTEITKGIPASEIGKTKKFKFNDIESIKRLVDEFNGQIACIVLEPATTSHPEKGFLKCIEEICKKNEIIFILDEMITGFRWDIKGAQKYYGVTPDLCTFGKAIANGFPLACVAGRKELMSLGSIDKPGQERVFLLSTTHGAETASLGAFIANIEFMDKNNVIKHIWNYGKKLIHEINKLAIKHKIDKSFKVIGVECSPQYQTLDKFGQNSLELKTFFMQEMIKEGIIIPWISLSYSHTEKELEITLKALDKVFEKYYEVLLHDDIKSRIQGAIVKPVFRKYN